MNSFIKRIVAGIITLSMMLSCIAIPSAATNENLVHSITFDNASDSIYTLKNKANLVKGRDGKAVQLVGADTSYVEIKDVSGISTITGDFTFSVWCYPNDETDWTRVYDLGTGIDKYIFLAPSNTFAHGYPRFVVKNGGGEQVLAGDRRLNLERWNNVTVVREGITTSMYINGMLSGTTADILINPADLGELTQSYIGKSQYPDPYFNGMVDDFCVYNSALSEEEVQILAEEAYANESVEIASEFDKYIIKTQFYNEDNTKIFQLNGESNIKANVLVKNSMTSKAEFSAKIFSYKDGVPTLIEKKDNIKLNVLSEKEVSFSVNVPQDCDYLNIVVNDVDSKQEFDCGYIKKSQMEFPDAVQEDNFQTTAGAHDPSIFKDPVTGKYWAYSSHNIIFESDDLINWKKHDYNGTITIPDKCGEFIEKNYPDTTANGTYWAPDMIYVPEDAEHPYWFYVSVSCGLGGRNSVMGLVKCKSPGVFDSDYVDCGVVFATRETNEYKTNAIDSNIYIDTDGEKYFVWGSFWGGIQVAPLNDDGTVKGINYTNDAAILSSCMNFGHTIYAVPRGVFGPEGPWMITNEDAGYRYLFTSYGWLGTNYNIRIARSSISDSMESILKKDAETYFLDQNENQVGKSYLGQEDKSVLWGYKMIGSYQLGDGIVYYGNGHNSVIQDGDDWYVVQHVRKMAESFAYLQVRKIIWTEDGWPVVSPLTYTGEKIQKIDEKMIYGTWDLTSVGHTIMQDGVTDISNCTSRDADLPVKSSEIVFMPNGKMNDDIGTWSFDGDHTVKINFKKDGKTYKNQYYSANDVMTMYVMTGYDKDKKESAVVMTGTNQNTITQFAKKSNASTADTRPAQVDTKNITLEKSEGNNPINRYDNDGNIIYSGDPAATVIGDTVYLYAGHDTANGNGYDIPEWVLYTSKDMVNWDYKGSVMSASDISWAANSTSAWASQVTEYKGKYYLYFCTWNKSDDGRQAIGVAVADSPEGPFVDIGKPLVKGSTTIPETSNFNDIDPTVYIETVDGVEHRYLGWGNGKYYICELNEDMISIVDKNGDGIINMSDIKTQRIKNMGSDWFTEAPWIYKRGDKYYTFFAANWREKMAYATADNIYGPWTYCGEIMSPTATSNTNHPSVIDFDGKTYFIYHNGSLPKGSGYRRSICIQELNFDKDGNVLPLTELSTGLEGTSSTITSYNGKYLAHEEFINSAYDGDYPIIKDVITINEEDGLNTAWEIIKSQYMPNTAEYISIQSVNKPGLYLCVDEHGSVVLTQNADGNMGKQMTFKTVEGLNGTGVSFESVDSEGRYLTKIGDRIYLSYGRDKDACTFKVGDATPTPVPTANPKPAPTPVPPLADDFHNDFNSLTTGTIMSMTGDKQENSESINGMTLYMGARNNGDASTSISIETDGLTGNAIVFNSGAFVSASRGPRMQAAIPNILENSTVVMTMDVKLNSNKSTLRYSDYTSIDNGDEITGFNVDEWSELKVTITDVEGERTRRIYVDNKIAAFDAVEQFPVIWGTNVNGTSSKVYFDNLSVVSFLHGESTINSVIGNKINVTANVDFAIVYAAKYNDNGSLSQVEMMHCPYGVTDLMAGFEPDKVFLWSGEGKPLANNWKK